MPDAPSEFVSLLPRRTAVQADDRPYMWLWVYDPESGQATVDHSEDKPAAHFLSHKTFARHIHHPDQVRGYANPIQGGWRIMDDEGKKVEDPYIIRQIQVALRKQHPKPPLPSIRYHGDPHAR